METPRLILLYSNPLLASALERAVATDASLETLPWPPAITELAPILTPVPPQVLILQGTSTLPVPPQDVVGLVKTTRPSVRVVVVMEGWTEEGLRSVLEAGADAALSYQSGVEHLKAAIEAVRHGAAAISPDLARVLFDWMQRRPLRQRHRQHLASTLNAQQLRILAALASGKRDREIAEEMFLSPKTVRNNVSIILQRLHVRDRGEAAVHAMAAGLTDQREVEQLLMKQ